MLTIDNNLAPLIQREADIISSRTPENRGIIQSLVSEFGARFRDNLYTFADVFELCRKVEVMLSEHQLSNELIERITDSRRDILYEIISHGMTNATLEGSLPPNFQLQFPVPTNGKTGRHRNRRERTREEYLEIVRNQNFDLLRFANWFGMDAAADALCALGLIGDEERARVISFISAYLGQCEAPPPLEEYNIFAYPRVVLEVPAVRSVVDRILMQSSYRELLEKGADDPLRYQQVRRSAPGTVLEYLQDIARRAQVTDPALHASIIVDQSNFFRRVVTQPHPRNLVRSLYEQGQKCPFPSLRQLIATQLLRERRKLYVGFEPGKGKTPIPFYLFEQLKQEGQSPRMLYLGPLPVIQELPNRIRPGSAPKETRDCYYINPENTAPTVGVITKELSTEEIDRLVHEQDVVFGSYTMLHSQRKAHNGDDEDLDEESVHLIDTLCNERWDMLVLDEAHFVDGNKQWTRLVDRLIHGESGRGTHLSRNGYVVGLSGSPIMNTIADPVVIHDLFTTPQERRQQYGTDLRDTIGRNTTIERGLDPRRARQALNSTLLSLDSPQNWLQNVDILDYQLSDREMEFINAICSNPTLHQKHKINACLQFILSPQLVSGDDSMPETLLEWASMQLESDLLTKNSILVAENMRAQGVLREIEVEGELDPTEMDMHFFKRIEACCRRWEQQHGQPVHFYTVHGHTLPAARQIAYADAKIAKEQKTHKVVILAMSQCLDIGIRLHLDGILTLEWPYNSPALQQLLMRALREGETNVRLTACYALGTVQQGIYEQSLDKYRQGLECQYGIGVSDAILSAHIRERSDEMDPQNEDDLIQLLHRTSPLQRRYEIERWLHGRGFHEVRQFWDRHRPLLDALYEESDELGTGDMQRFIGSCLAGLLERNRQDSLNILDINSGGLTVERELRRLEKRNSHILVSTDIHPAFLERGRTAIYRDNSNSLRPSCIEANPRNIHRLCENGQLIQSQFDIVILQNLHQCDHIQQERTVHERAGSLLSTLKTLRVGGKIMIPLSRTACTNEEFNHLVDEALPLFGCLPVEGWFGQVRSSDHSADQPFRGFCVIAEKFEDVDEATLRERLSAEHLRFTHHARWAETSEGVRIRNALRKPKLPYPLRHNEFRFGNRTFTATANEEISVKQEEHLNALTGAVRTIRSVAPTSRDWRSLHHATKRSLNRQGILFCPDLSPTDNRPIFRLRDYPRHLFFPYDTQWDSVESD